MLKNKLSVSIITILTFIIFSKNLFAVNDKSLFNRLSFTFLYAGNDKLKLNYSNNLNSINSNFAKNLEFGINYSLIKKFKIRYNVGLCYGINTTKYSFDLYSRFTKSEISDIYVINDENYIKLSNEFYKNIYNKNKYAINFGVGLNFKYAPNTLSTLNVYSNDNNNNTELLMSNYIDYNPNNKLIKTISIIIENEYKLKYGKVTISNILDYSFNDDIDYTIIFNPTTLERDQFNMEVKNRLTLGIRLNYYL